MKAGYDYGREFDYGLDLILDGLDGDWRPSDQGHAPKVLFCQNSCPPTPRGSTLDHVASTDDGR